MPEADLVDVLSAWATRMTARHRTNMVWDQIRGEEITWLEALWRWHHGPTIIAGGYPWSEDDVKHATSWEMAVGHDDRNWPLFVMTPAQRSLTPCDFHDHEWEIEFIEGAYTITCSDPCEPEKVIATWTGKGQPSIVEQNRDTIYYFWNACHPNEYDDVHGPLRSFLEGQFAVRITRVEEVDGDYQSGYGSYSRYIIEPVFDRKSLVCTGCGVEVVPPRVARSIDNNEPLCPSCGRKDKELRLFEQARGS